MTVQIINRKSCPYTIAEVWDKAVKNIEPAFRPKLPMEAAREHGRNATEEQLERFKNRPGRVLWDYEARCRRCHRIEEKQNLTDGLCESCRQEQKESTDDSDRANSSRPETEGSIRGGTGEGSSPQT